WRPGGMVEALLQHHLAVRRAGSNAVLGTTDCDRCRPQRGRACRKNGRPMERGDAMISRSLSPSATPMGEGQVEGRPSRVLSMRYFAATATASPLSSTFRRNVAYLARVRSNAVGYS